MALDSVISDVQNCVCEFTDITPEIYTRKGSTSIMLCWEVNIPNEETTSKIEEALKQFGTVLPNHYREGNFISFKIMR